MSEEEIINVITKMLEKNDDIFEETGNHLYFSKMTAEAIQGLLDLYNKEREKNKKIEDKIKEKIEWLEKNIIDNDYASDNDKDVAENQIYMLEWLI